MTSADNILGPRDPQTEAADAAPIGDAVASGFARPAWLARLRRVLAIGEARPPVGGPRRPIIRYGLAIAAVAAAILAMTNVPMLAERPPAFPFYAAVVISAWLGAGPGFIAVLLSVVAVEYVWAPSYLTLRAEAQDLPWFLSFIACMLMSFAWSRQRRRAQHALEATVRERTADLLSANAALHAEMAEREAAEKERRRTERALRDAEAELARTLRLAAMAELAAAIAHEINQPLAAITANGSACLRSLSREPPLLDNAREAAGCIVADGHRAGDVIARIRALFNKEPPNKQPLPINDIIRHTLDLSQSAIGRQRVVVRTELAASAPIVMADPVQLQQVMVNLVTNALEAMAGTAEPRVLTVRSEVDRRDGVVVTVEDTGSGLDPEQVTHIFDSFFTTKPNGIGLGLAISRSIIEMHGGSMWAAPGTPGGAKLGFSLPPAVPPDLFSGSTRKSYHAVPWR